MVAQENIKSGILLYQYRFPGAETAVDGDRGKEQNNTGRKQNDFLNGLFFPFFPDQKKNNRSGGEKCCHRMGNDRATAENSGGKDPV